jgi:hypothetical protein
MLSSLRLGDRVDGCECVVVGVERAGPEEAWLAEVSDASGSLSAWVDERRESVRASHASAPAAGSRVRVSGALVQRNAHLVLDARGRGSLVRASDASEAFSEPLVRLSAPRHEFGCAVLRGRRMMLASAGADVPFSFPRGAADPGESPWAAAVRATVRATDVSPGDFCLLGGLPPIVYYADVRDDGAPTLVTLFPAYVTGERMSNEGSDDEEDEEEEDETSDEAEWDWFTFEEAQEEMEDDSVSWRVPRDHAAVWALCARHACQRARGGGRGGRAERAARRAVWPEAWARREAE